MRVFIYSPAPFFTDIKALCVQNLLSEGKSSEQNSRFVQQDFHGLEIFSVSQFSKNTPH